ncbi:hypothetical protein MnTg02_02303 [bacterium MnTg02]|nr:hypothetical protein MnTg02_02303 [bacterium MnTg02]
MGRESQRCGRVLAQPLRATAAYGNESYDMDDSARKNPARPSLKKRPPKKSVVSLKSVAKISQTRKAAPTRKISPVKPAYAPAVNKAAENMEATVPVIQEAVQNLAVTSLAHSHSAYLTVKEIAEQATEAFGTAMEEASKGSHALNVKMIQMAQANLNSSFDLAKELVRAKDITEAVDVHNAFVQQQFESLAGQAEEIRQLSKRIAVETVKPLKSHVSRAFDTGRSSN